MHKMGMTKAERAEARAKAQKEKNAAAKKPKKAKAVAGHESYWTYAPGSETSTVEQLPKGAFSGTQSDFEKLSPGMRREIARSASKPIERKAAPVRNIGDNHSAAPTTEVAAQMQEAFDFLNHRLFDGKLPPVMLSWTRLKKAHGYFWAKTWTRKGEKDRSTHEIALDPFRCAQEKDKDVLGTLAHEMVHELDEEEGTAPKRPYHTKIWAERMKAIGLYPSTTAQPGGKETGPNCSHYIIEGGLFDKAADDLLAKGFRFTWTTIPAPEKPKGKKKKAGAKAKHECPDCGAAAWGKPSLHIGCRDCGVPMICAEAGEYEGGDG